MRATGCPKGPASGDVDFMPKETPVDRPILVRRCTELPYTVTLKFLERADASIGPRNTQEDTIDLTGPLRGTDTPMEKAILGALDNLEALCSWNRQGDNRFRAHNEPSRFGRDLRRPAACAGPAGRHSNRRVITCRTRCTRTSFSRVIRTYRSTSSSSGCVTGVRWRRGRSTSYSRGASCSPRSRRSTPIPRNPNSPSRR